MAVSNSANLKRSLAGSRHELPESPPRSTLIQHPITHNALTDLSLRLCTYILSITFFPLSAPARAQPI